MRVLAAIVLVLVASCCQAMIRKKLPSLKETPPSLTSITEVDDVEELDRAQLQRLVAEAEARVGGYLANLTDKKLQLQNSLSDDDSEELADQVAQAEVAYSQAQKDRDALALRLQASDMQELTAQEHRAWKKQQLAPLKGSALDKRVPFIPRPLKLKAVSEELDFTEPAQLDSELDVSGGKKLMPFLPRLDLRSAKDGELGKHARSDTPRPGLSLDEDSDTPRPVFVRPRAKTVTGIAKYLRVDTPRPSLREQDEDEQLQVDELDGFPKLQSTSGQKSGSRVDTPRAVSLHSKVPVAPKLDDDDAFPQLADRRKSRQARRTAGSRPRVHFQDVVSGARNQVKMQRVEVQQPLPLRRQSTGYLEPVKKARPTTPAPVTGKQESKPTSVALATLDEQDENLS
eukprot:gnl/Hemi2/26742_TR8993_c0_g1_i1.p1 gnl/Hemi2/26742_TR8993_c0_g1~~gnl/Hemi2/26742_TR8993_c0_g1_i1.p1  ORF type:complete len:414 (-),score=86.96 gnl/Hemi2/26742_TR8993_c0_g1_i1:14-1213(-)